MKDRIVRFASRSACLWLRKCLIIAAITITALTVPGCPRKQSASPAKGAKDASTAPRASVTLKVLVVNDAELAAAINRLRGEWAERGGGALTAEAKPWSHVSAAKSIDADVIIFPARYLGELVETNRLRPMRASAFGSELYDSDDVMSLARRKLANYGRHTTALPLTVEMPLVAYRLNWLEETGGLPPEFRRAFLDHASRGTAMMWPPRGTIEHWPAMMLLARAAGYAQHPQQEFALFDLQTMKPRIAEPPFVRALEEWQREKSPLVETNAGQNRQHLRWAELPGPGEVYDRSSDTWQPNGRVPLPTSVLAGGSLLAVTSSTRNAASAFDLSVWLASPEISRQLAPIGKGTLPVRRSQLATIGRWVDSPLGRTDGAQLAQVVQTALDRGEALIVPRLPGADDYFAALSDAVEQAFGNKATPVDALQEAAGKWDVITEQLGRDAQRRAYLRDLGLDGP